MQLVNAGIEPGTSSFEYKRIRLTNILALSAPLLDLPVGLFYLSRRNYLIAGLIGMAIVLYAIVFFLNRARYYYPARFLFILTALMSTVIGTVTLGRGAMVQCVLISFVMLPFLMFPENRKRWLVFSLFCVLIAYAVTEFLSYRVMPVIEMGEGEQALNYHFNLIMLIFVLGFFTYFLYSENNRAERFLRDQKAQSDALLLNILPAEVAQELKMNGRVRPRFLDSVTVMFTDFVDFTARSQRLVPAELIGLINEYFTEFDAIVRRHGLEKLKTIGDAYMCAGGLDGEPGHADRCLSAAREIRDFVAGYARVARSTGRPWFDIRIGLHSGPVVAGVIGSSKFSYDIWGDTVNTAARIQGFAEAGSVSFSHETKKMIEKEKFPIADRGVAELKGKGQVRVFCLVPEVEAVAGAGTPHSPAAVAVA